MANRYTTICGDIVMIEIYHEYVAKQPNGLWYGFDSKPFMDSTCWGNQWDSPDILKVVNINDPSVDWKTTCEKSDFYQEQRMREAAKPKYCRVCGNIAKNTFQETKVHICESEGCHAKLKNFWDEKIREVNRDFDREISRKHWR